MNPDGRTLYTVREFCWRNSIGKTKFFELVKANALHVVRLDGRLMIPADSEKEWIASLPSARSVRQNPQIAPQT